MHEMKRSRFTAFLMALVMVMTLLLNPLTAVKVSAEQVFSDVAPKDWFYGYVMNLYNKGIIKGYGTSGEFRPRNMLIREHAAKMIAIAAGLDYEGKKAEQSSRELAKEPFNRLEPGDEGKKKGHEGHVKSLSPTCRPQP